MGDGEIEKLRVRHHPGPPAGRAAAAIVIGMKAIKAKRRHKGSIGASEVVWKPGGAGVVVAVNDRCS